MRLSKYRPSKDHRLELSTTSMIDVVFLLLIFFLVTTTFLRPERQIKPNIKTMQETSGAVTDLEPAIIDIFVADGKPVYRIGGVVSGEIDRIESVLKQLGDRSRSSGAFVRLADEAPYGMAAVAINACKSNGFVPVTLVPY